VAKRRAATSCRLRSTPCTHSRGISGIPTGTQLGTLYDQLYAISPTPIVALNRAIVIAELDGPAVALADVERLGLQQYHACVRHQSRPATPPRPLHRRHGAPYDAAIDLAVNAAEIRYLKRRRASLAPWSR